MDFISSLGIAAALAMDAFAVAIAAGVRLKTVTKRQTFRLAWHFGLFQAIMTLIGWKIGSAILVYIKTYGHWIAFTILFLVGANMMRGLLPGRNEKEERLPGDMTRGMTMIMLSVATSIDALAVGVSLSLLDTPILQPALTIGIVAILFTVSGLHLGKKAAAFQSVGPFAELVGGIILWIIGLNILRANGVFTNLF